MDKTTCKLGEYFTDAIEADYLRRKYARENCSQHCPDCPYLQVIENTKELRIVNTEQLPRGTGAKYLLALRDDLHGVLIAHSWKRTAPKSIPADYVLVKMGA